MDAISIEETNKIRIAVGLKPLPVPGSSGPAFKPSKDSASSEEDDPGSTLESRQAQGYDNWKKLQDERDAKAQREARNEAIKKARDTAQKYSQLQGKTLGAADEHANLDTKTWLKKQPKRKKEIEKERLRKLEKELAERDNEAQYTAEDLAGVKVGHELGEFEVGEEQVLTLKDSTIDQNEEEGDELENVSLRERELISDRLELKKKKPVYDPHASEEGDKSILKHYDETIDGKKRKRFTLDGKGATAEEREALKQAVGEKLKAQPINLDIFKDMAPVSDYQDAQEVKIRKPKKKKAKTTRQKVADEDDIVLMDPTNDATANGESMDVDSAAGKPSTTTKPKDTNTSFVDDDDLQASLALQRRLALKKRKKMTPEDIARQLREEEATTPGPQDQDPDEMDEGPGLVIDETSEFVANLQRPEAPKVQSTKPANGAKSESPPVKEEDVDMDRSPASSPDNADLKLDLKRETSPSAQEDMGLGTEATLDRGIGSTLNLLTQRRILEQDRGEDLNARFRASEQFRAQKARMEADAATKARLQRELDRASGRFDRMSARDREEYARLENKQRDQQESRRMAEIFDKEYQPNIDLKYTDEFGRSMSQKEAFKHLSHQFHGKGSGKQKTDKHLKKIEGERKRESGSVLDASRKTGMDNAMGATAKKNRQAGVRLG